jgi:hypothetical protein
MALVLWEMYGICTMLRLVDAQHGTLLSMLVVVHSCWAGVLQGCGQGESLYSYKGSFDATSMVLLS